MSPQEVRDTVNSRLKRRRNEIYALSRMFRVAVLSCFEESGVTFPDAPYGENEEQEGSWQKSYNFMSELSKIHKGKEVQ
jgi:hypothetical protein